MTPTALIHFLLLLEAIRTDESVFFHLPQVIGEAPHISIAVFVVGTDLYVAIAQAICMRYLPSGLHKPVSLTSCTRHLLFRPMARILQLFTSIALPLSPRTEPEYWRPDVGLRRNFARERY
ncbi:MAG: hypothetical protein R2824_31465 [Saprospiraceae bacterium]